jgi:hypothetical protein
MALRAWGANVNDFMCDFRSFLSFKGNAPAPGLGMMLV